jgi:hypothetical protein
MVRIEKNKIFIELEQTSPEEFYKSLLNDTITCIQALREADLEEDMYFLLELYKALLPDQEQVNKMFGKKKPT